MAKGPHSGTCYNFGLFLGNPKYGLFLTILVSLLYISLIGAGQLWGAEVIESISELWIPEGSSLRTNNEYVVDNSNPNAGTTSELFTLFLKEDGANIMVEKHLDDWLQISEDVQGIVVEHNGLKYTTQDLCLMAPFDYYSPCFQPNVLDCFEEGRYSFPLDAGALFVRFAFLTGFDQAGDCCDHSLFWSLTMAAPALEGILNVIVPTLTQHCWTPPTIADPIALPAIPYMMCTEEAGVNAGFGTGGASDFFTGSIQALLQTSQDASEMQAAVYQMTWNYVAGAAVTGGLSCSAFESAGYDTSQCGYGTVETNDCNGGGDPCCSWKGCHESSVGAGNCGTRNLNGGTGGVCVKLMTCDGAGENPGTGTDECLPGVTTGFQTSCVDGVDIVCTDLENCGIGNEPCCAPFPTNCDAGPAGLFDITNCHASCYNTLKDFIGGLVTASPPATPAPASGVHTLINVAQDGKYSTSNPLDPNPDVSDKVFSNIISTMAGGACTVLRSAMDALGYDGLGAGLPIGLSYTDPVTDKSNLTHIGANPMSIENCADASFHFNELNLAMGRAITRCLVAGAGSKTLAECQVDINSDVAYLTVQEDSGVVLVDSLGSYPPEIFSGVAARESAVLAGIKSNPAPFQFFMQPFVDPHNRRPSYKDPSTDIFLELSHGCFPADPTETDTKDGTLMPPWQYQYLLGDTEPLASELEGGTCVCDSGFSGSFCSVPIEDKLCDCIPDETGNPGPNCQVGILEACEDNDVAQNCVLMDFLRLPSTDPQILGARALMDMVGALLSNIFGSSSIVFPGCKDLVNCQQDGTANLGDDSIYTIWTSLVDPSFVVPGLASVHMPMARALANAAVFQTATDDSVGQQPDASCFTCSAEAVLGGVTSDLVATGCNALSATGYTGCVAPAGLSSLFTGVDPATDPLNCVQWIACHYMDTNTLAETQVKDVINGGAVPGNCATARTDHDTLLATGDMPSASCDDWFANYVSVVQTPASLPVVVTDMATAVLTAPNRVADIQTLVPEASRDTAANAFLDGACDLSVAGFTETVITGEDCKTLFQLAGGVAVQDGLSLLTYGNTLGKYITAASFNQVCGSGGGSCFKNSTCNDGFCQAPAGGFKLFTRVGGLQGAHVLQHPYQLVKRWADTSNAPFRAAANSRYLAPADIQQVTLGLTVEDAETIIHKWREALEEIDISASGAAEAGYGVLHDESLTRLTSGYAAASGPLIALGYFLMILYAGLTLTFWTSNTSQMLVQSRAMVGVGGVLMVAVSVFTGFSTAVMFEGLEMNASSLQILPFLLLGLGVDDMFVMARTFPTYREGLTAHEATAIGMSVAGPSIALTSLTNAGVFSMGILTKVPLVIAISGQSAISVGFNFLSIMVVFPVMLSLDYSRQGKGLMDCFPLVKGGPAPHGGSKSGCTHRVAGAYGRFVVSPLGKVLGLLVLTILIAVGLAGYLDPDVLRYGLRLGDVAPRQPEGNVQKIVDAVGALEADFAVYPFALIYAEGDYSSKTAQDELIAIYNRLIAQDHVVSFPHWYFAFLLWGVPSTPKYDNFGQINGEPGICNSANQGTNGECGEKHNCVIITDASANPLPYYHEDDFYRCLELWINYDLTAGLLNPGVVLVDFEAESPDKKLFYTDFPANTTIPKLMVANLVAINLYENDDFLSFIEGTIFASESETVTSFSVGVPISFWSQYLDLPETIRSAIFYSLCFAFGASTFMLMVVAQGDDHISALQKLIVSVWGGIIIVSIVAMLAYEVYGFCGWFELKISAIPAVTIIMSVGVGVEFTAHITLSFINASGTRDERVLAALDHMFIPTVDGGVSTLIGICMLGFTELEFLFKYYFLLYLIVVSLGFINGLFVLPVVLSFAGPPAISFADDSDGIEDGLESNKQVAPVQA